MIALGTQMKTFVSVELPGGFTLDDVEYSITYTSSQGGSYTLPREFMRTEEDGILCIVDTSKVGTGLYSVILEVMIPDELAPEGRRKIVHKERTNIRVNR